MAFRPVAQGLEKNIAHTQSVSKITKGVDSLSECSDQRKHCDVENGDGENVPRNFAYFEDIKELSVEDAFDTLLNLSRQKDRYFIQCLAEQYQFMGSRMKDLETRITEGEEMAVAIRSCIKNDNEDLQSEIQALKKLNMAVVEAANEKIAEYRIIIESERGRREELSASLETANNTITELKDLVQHFKTNYIKENLSRQMYTNQNRIDLKSMVTAFHSRQSKTEQEMELLRANWIFEANERKREEEECRQQIERIQHMSNKKIKDLEHTVETFMKKCESRGDIAQVVSPNIEDQVGDACKPSYDWRQMDDVMKMKMEFLDNKMASMQMAVDFTSEDSETDQNPSTAESLAESPMISSEKADDQNVMSPLHNDDATADVDISFPQSYSVPDGDAAIASLQAENHTNAISCTGEGQKNIQKAEIIVFPQ